MTVTQAQMKLATAVRARRLADGLTQEGLATRAGVSLPTLRKFEQKGLISLESFLKLLMVLDGLEDLVFGVEPKEQRTFSSIDDVLRDKPTKPQRKKGWRK